MHYIPGNVSSGIIIVVILFISLLRLLLLFLVVTVDWRERLKANATIDHIAIKDEGSITTTTTTFVIASCRLRVIRSTFLTAFIIVIVIVGVITFGVSLVHQVG